MILIFHSACIIIKLLYRNYIRVQFLKNKLKFLAVLQSDLMLPNSSANNYRSNIIFDPPVYLQRYSKVAEYLLDEKWKDVVHEVADFGCGEFGFSSYLKSLTNIERIVHVDIDEDLLLRYLYKANPSTYDYLKSKGTDLSIEVYVGSASAPDINVMNIDAVVGIELIEHLYPDTLEALPYNVFAFIQPKIVIFTTPNADFNVLFPNFRGFRHYDHKFEWTMEQFQSWAINITHRFPNYSVFFDGVGYGPPDTRHLGACSQMAIFVRSSVLYSYNLNRRMCIGFCPVSSDRLHGERIIYEQLFRREQYPYYESYGICTYHSYSKPLHDYEMTSSMEFRNEYYEYEDELRYITNYKMIERFFIPLRQELRTPDEILSDELIYSVNLVGKVFGRFYNHDRNRSEIPVFELIGNQQRFYTTENQATLLERAGYKVEICGDVFTDEAVKCIIYEPEMGTVNNYSSNPEESEESDWENCTDDNEKFAQDVVNEIVDSLNYCPSQSSASDWDTEDVCSTSREFVSSNYRELTLCDSGYSNMPSYLSEEGSENEEMFDRNEILQQTLIPKVETTSSIVKSNVETEENKKESIDTKVPKNKPKKEKSKSTIKQKSDLVDSKSFSKQEMNEIKKKDNSDFKKRTQTEEMNDATKRNEKIKSPTGSVIVSKNDFSSSSKRNEDVMMNPSGSSNNWKNKRKNKKNDDLKREENVVEVIEAEGLNVRVAVVRPGNNLLNEAPRVVENGDLVNNNRDYEGNNYPNAIVQPNDDRINIEDNENRNRMAGNDNGNEMNAEDQHELVPHVVRLRRENVMEGMEQQEQEEEVDGVEELPEVERASREALFDPNSQVDISDSYINPPDNGEAMSDVRQNNGIILIGIRRIDETNRIVPPRIDMFPNWLLHLLESDELVNVNLHDEPHFYCQGDGLGVHPSVIEVDLEEDSDSSSDVSSPSTGEDNATLQTNSNTQSDMTSILLDTDSQSHQGSVQETSQMASQSSKSSMLNKKKSNTEREECGQVSGEQLQQQTQNVEDLLVLNNLITVNLGERLDNVENENNAENSGETGEEGVDEKKILENDESDPT